MQHKEEQQKTVQEIIQNFEKGLFLENRFQEIRKDNKIQFWGFLAAQIVSDKHNLNES